MATMVTLRLVDGREVRVRGENRFFLDNLKAKGAVELGSVTLAVCGECGAEHDERVFCGHGR